MHSFIRAAFVDGLAVLPDSGQEGDVHCAGAIFVKGAAVQGRRSRGWQGGSGSSMGPGAHPRRASGQSAVNGAGSSTSRRLSSWERKVRARSHRLGPQVLDMGARRRCYLQEPEDCSTGSIECVDQHSDSFCRCADFRGFVVPVPPPQHISAEQERRPRTPR